MVKGRSDLRPKWKKAEVTGIRENMRNKNLMCVDVSAYTASHQGKHAEQEPYVCDVSAYTASNQENLLLGKNTEKKCLKCNFMRL